MLISFWAPQTVDSGYGSQDDTRFRDSHFFSSTEIGELTTYAKGVQLAFVAYVALRVTLVVGSIVGISVFSGNLLGGMFARNPSAKSPTTPKHARPVFPSRDPNKTPSPQKSWLVTENEFNWSWRDRTRARIQDAFELCMIRREHSTFLSMSVPWGAQSRSTLPLEPLTPSLRNAIPRDQLLYPNPISAQTSGNDVFLLPHVPPQAGLSPPRPESAVLPDGKEEVLREEHSSSRLNPSPAGASDVSSSSNDIFYTPIPTPQPNRTEDASVTEFGVKRLSHESDESISDDSAALLSSPTSGRARSSTFSTIGASSRKSSLARRDPTGASPTQKLLTRARSTSVGLLRESIANSSGIIKRARSGTMLSQESQYSRVYNSDVGPRESCQRRGSSHTPQLRTCPDSDAGWILVSPPTSPTYARRQLELKSI